MLDVAGKRLLSDIFDRHAHTLITDTESGEELVLTASPVQPEEMDQVEGLISSLYKACALEGNNFSGLIAPGDADFSDDVDPDMGYLLTDSPTTALLLQLTAMN